VSGEQESSSSDLNRSEDMVDGAGDKDKFKNKNKTPKKNENEEDKKFKNKNKLDENGKKTKEEKKQKKEKLLTADQFAGLGGPLGAGFGESILYVDTILSEYEIRNGL
jgi:hypothetical protein